MLLPPLPTDEIYYLKKVEFNPWRDIQSNLFPDGWNFGNFIYPMLYGGLCIAAGAPGLEKRKWVPRKGPGSEKFFPMKPNVTTQPQTYWPRITCKKAGGQKSFVFIYGFFTFPKNLLKEMAPWNVVLERSSHIPNTSSITRNKVAFAECEGIMDLVDLRFVYHIVFGKPDGPGPPLPNYLEEKVLLTKIQRSQEHGPSFLRRLPNFILVTVRTSCQKQPVRKAYGKRITSWETFFRSICSILKHERIFIVMMIKP